MLKIGITGNIGSGKTTICKIFEHLGVAVYYSDAKAKQFYSRDAVKEAVKNLFGEAVFDAGENVDVKKLATHVFQNENELQKLNRLLHPLVVNDFQEWCKQHENQRFVLFEAAIIYQCGLENLFDKIIFVDAPADVLLQRVALRDKVDVETAKQRLENQQQNAPKSACADFIIYNDGKRSLIEAVMKIHTLLNQ